MKRGRAKSKIRRNSRSKPKRSRADESCRVPELQSCGVSEVSEVSEVLEEYEELNVSLAGSGLHLSDSVPTDSSEEVVTNSSPSEVEGNRDADCEQLAEEWGIFYSGRYGELEQRRFIQMAAEADEACRDKPQPPGWEFARYCKGYPSFACLTGDELYNEIEWDTDTSFDEEVREKIIGYFDVVKFTPDEGPLNWALKMTHEYPLHASKRPLYDRFISLAGWLQVNCGDNPIYLPQKSVAEILNVAGSTISSMTNSALKDGYITLVTEHTRYIAARYRFDLVKFPVLQKWQ